MTMRSRMPPLRMRWHGPDEGREGLEGRDDWNRTSAGLEARGYILTCCRGTHRVQQTSRGPKIARLETFREPVVDRDEQFARGVTLSLRQKHFGERRRRSQLP